MSNENNEVKKERRNEMKHQLYFGRTTDGYFTARVVDENGVTTDYADNDTDATPKDIRKTYLVLNDEYEIDSDGKIVARTVK